MGLAGVDPYLRAHLRLAERQGLLTGRHLSEPQSYGLIVLNYLDEIEAAKRANRDFKIGMLSTGYDPEKLFPEHFAEDQKKKKEEAQRQAEADGGITPEDLRNVEWKSPKDYSAAEMANIERMLTTMNSGSIFGSDLASGEDPAKVSWTDWS